MLNKTHLPSSLHYVLDVVLDHDRRNFIVLLDYFLEEREKKKSMTTGQKCTDDLVISCGKIAVILQNCKFSEIVLGLIGAAFITVKPHNPGGTT